MLNSIYIILEICSVLVLFRCFSGKKARIYIRDSILISANVIISELLVLYSADNRIFVITYLFTFIYSIVEFDGKVKEVILGNLILYIIMGLLQLMSALIFILLRISFISEELQAIVINLNVLLLVIGLRKLFCRFFRFLLLRNILVSVAIAIFAVVIFYEMYCYKFNSMISVENFIFLLSFGGLICELTFCWQKEKETVTLKSREIQMYNLYSQSYKELIQAIREKQHDFNNHIQAIHSQHLMIHTYDELVMEQEKYCKTLMKDNRFYCLLNGEMSILSGFLYSKFVEASNLGIEIEYSVVFCKLEKKIPEYILVEMIGILWDNAVEFVCDKEQKKIYFGLGNQGEKMSVTVSNPVRDIPYSEISKFFEKGYSTKSEHLGIGLHKIMQYSRQYDLDIRVEKKRAEDTNWLEINITG